MSTATGSFFNSSDIIRACEHALKDYVKERKDNIAKFCFDNRLERQFPKIWVVKTLTGDEVIEKYRNAEDIFDVYKLELIEDKFHGEIQVEQLLDMAYKSNHMIFVTTKDFKRISKYMPKVNTP